MNKFFTWSISTWERKRQSLCQASLYRLGGGVGLGKHCFFWEPLKRKWFPFIIFVPSCSDPPSLYYVTTHLKPKEGLMGCWLFSTATNIMNLGMFGICWLLLAMCPLFAFLKEGREWWFHVPFGINFPEPKTQYTWLLLKWCVPLPPSLSYGSRCPQTPDLAQILPKGVSEESTNLCKRWSKKREVSQLYARIFQCTSS